MDFDLPEDIRLMQATINKFVNQTLEPLSAQIEEDDAIPEDVVQSMREMGLFGMSVPEEYGGLGLPTLGECLVYEEISRVNSSVRMRFSTNNGIGSLGILYDGTPEQRERFLPSIASGEKTIAFALTEPDAGSDASAIRTSAVRDGDQFVLNGRKMFITNGAIADLITVLAVTDPDKGARGGITAFVVAKPTPGLEVGKLEKKMGLRGSGTAELIFEDCRVPVDNVIGGEEMIGRGFQTAMKVLDKGRLTLAASSVGMARKALELAVLYAKQRVQFGRPIGEFQLIQGMLAQMATEIYAGQTMVYRTAWQKDQGRPVRKEAAMSKLYCTEMLGRVCDSALQIHGGMGYMKEYAIERIYRDARVTRIYEGTSEIQKLVIAKELLRD
ncbi:MAG: acyl-CoA dehydrogenase family protein [Proteobacteria bacterium]|nr:acyl-CoA dehydrogenase family protein [Pseudomonadota bacterium]MBU1452751.1 acyl-CoA dehydrogenase family protein [Pseudomonadota bacterium]